MTDRTLAIIKGISLTLAGIAVAVSGMSFYQHRHFKESVAAVNVTDVKMVSDYYPPIKGTYADATVFVFDSGKPGGTMLLLGGSHPEEPAGPLTAQLFAENAKLTEGRLFVVIHANQSGSTVTRPGDGYPQFYNIPTAWGGKTFRMGDRWSNPLDSWPDPEVFVHYPSGQMLAYVDVRNHNRAWPGRPDGMSAEQSTYGFMQMIKAEKVDFVIDMHEAELEYPVINTIVAHQKCVDIAGLVAMTLSAEEFDVPIGMEYSPTTLHGLTHREIGDNSDSAGFLLESPEPFLDRVRGVTDEALLLTGKDPFVVIAGEHKLLYSPIDEKGWPIDVRVGRHTSTVLSIADMWSDMNPDKPIRITSVPRYADIIKNGIGHYFLDPEKTPKDKVFYN